MHFIFSEYSIRIYDYRDRSDGGDQLDEMLSSKTVLIQERNKLLMESNRLDKCPNCEIGLPKFPEEKEPM